MITRTEAMDFLREHQPMPKDGQLEEGLIKKYDEVRQFFLENPDEECIPLFLNSFGGRDGFGVYQMVEDVKYWCVQISANFPDISLFNSLVQLLESGDEDIKAASVTALAQLARNHLCVDKVVGMLEEAQERSTEEDMREFIDEVLDDLRKSGCV